MKRRFIIILLLLALFLLSTSCSDNSKTSQYISDKELLLSFLCDEIPIINYFQEGDKIYFSDIDKLSNPDEKIFYIADMTGNGKSDFVIQIPGAKIIIIYDEEKECFELWLTETTKYYPIGDKQMYYYNATTATVYAYLVYDEYANLINEKIFSAEEYHDKEKGSSAMKFEIDWKPVSESKWYEEIEFLLDLIREAPKPLSYYELLTDSGRRWILHGKLRS